MLNSEKKNSLNNLGNTNNTKVKLDSNRSSSVQGYKKNKNCCL